MGLNVRLGIFVVFDEQSRKNLNSLDFLRCVADGLPEMKSSMNLLFVGMGWRVQSLGMAQGGGTIVHGLSVDEGTRVPSCL